MINIVENVSFLFYSRSAYLPDYRRKPKDHSKYSDMLWHLGLRL